MRNKCKEGSSFPGWGSPSRTPDRKWFLRTVPLCLWQERQTPDAHAPCLPGPAPLTDHGVPIQLARPKESPEQTCGRQTLLPQGPKSRVLPQFLKRPAQAWSPNPYQGLSGYQALWWMLQKATVQLCLQGPPGSWFFLWGFISTSTPRSEKPTQKQLSLS